MIYLPQMILVAGNSRNSGKTSMACNLIRHLSENHQVVAVKFTSIRPEEADFHGRHAEGFDEDFIVREEVNPPEGKDTNLMLKAGAVKVFYVSAHEKFLEKALLLFLTKVINKQLIVCESRSLRTIVKPGLFLMMMRQNDLPIAKHVDEYLSIADKICTFGHIEDELADFVKAIEYKREKYHLRKN